ncbi:RNA1 polyprotein [Bienertia sinuspersici]
MASVAKVKPINKNQAGPSSSKPILKRKIETSIKQSSAADIKNKSNPIKTVKSEDKGKSVVNATPVKKKREKKVYSLAGQKYDPPEEVYVHFDLYYILNFSRLSIIEFGLKSKSFVFFSTERTLEDIL